MSTPSQQLPMPLNKSPLPVPNAQPATAVGAPSPVPSATTSPAAAQPAAESTGVIGAVLRLTDSSEPIAGATVQVLSGGAVCGQAVTDANGAFEIASGSSCGAAGGELTFRVNGAAPVKSTKLPHGNTTMVLLFVQ